MKWQTLFQTKKTRSSNENDSDSLGLFKLLESRTFDYLSLFQGKKKRKKSNSRSVRWIEKKESRWNSRWTKWTREETPSPPWNASCPSRRHPPSFRFIPVYPDVFRERSPVGHLPGHNYNWRNVGYLLINRRLSLIFCCSRTESGIKNVGWYGLDDMGDGTKEEESERKGIRNRGK